MTAPTDFRQQFVEFAIRQNALCFGEFKTKAGRLSPYFFNSGLFSDGASLAALGRFYAKAALASGIKIDTIFGPAYKGITLAAAMAVALAEMGHNLPFCFNRKEAKDHGEGGLIVGAPLKGNVLIVDDVITDGASKRESVEMIRAVGATPVGVLIALDRQERGVKDGNTRSAAQEFAQMYGVPVIAVATLDDIVAFLMRQGDENDKLTKIQAYRQKYGADL
ncbi:MAG: orotate phosphoribosyltransferase [Betaproteobacteria bacterium]|nr:orotate phosphoribosyltransferase [Betaproteobacteria bacterium]